jgi:ankyrin repeat protein
MNTIHSLIRRLYHSTIPHRAAVPLVALAWSSPGYGGAIHYAALAGNLKNVQMLVKANPGLVFSKDNKGNAPLDLATQNGHMDIDVLLLTSKAEFNAKSNYGYTPLLEAARHNHKDMVNLHLANGADVNARKNSGQSDTRIAELGVIPNN